jgi:hypothetical protein
VGEKFESSALPKLVSVPVLLAMGILGFAVILLARLFGPETIVREVIAEVVASFGSTLLVIAIFGLLFRSGLERVLRGAPGGEAFMESVVRLKDIVQDLDEREGAPQGARYEAKLDRIGEDVRSLADDELPALRNEMAELRKLLARSEHERGN